MIMFRSMQTSCSMTINGPGCHDEIYATKPPNGTLRDVRDGGGIRPHLLSHLLPGKLLELLHIDYIR